MKKSRPKTLSLIAFVLLLVSLPLPYWTVIMDAPTYPEKNLSMRVYTYYYEGDIDEWNVVGNLVGVHMPPPIPEEIFIIIPVAVVFIAILSLICVFKPSLLKFSMVTPWLLLIFLTAWTQYSLYIFGHNLDPERPLRYVDPFTPPVIGVKKIGSLITYHLPHIGSILLVIAGILLVVSYNIVRKENIHAKTPDPA
jgi:amino acid transporter